MHGASCAARRRSVALLARVRGALLLGGKCMRERADGVVAMTIPRGKQASFPSAGNATPEGKRIEKCRFPLGNALLSH
jgi:hypothetical protein